MHSARKVLGKVLILLSLLVGVECENIARILDLSFVRFFCFISHMHGQKMKRQRVEDVVRHCGHVFGSGNSQQQECFAEELEHGDGGEYFFARGLIPRDRVMAARELVLQAMRDRGDLTIQTNGSEIVTNGKGSTFLFCLVVVEFVLFAFIIIAYRLKKIHYSLYRFSKGNLFLSLLFRGRI